MRLHPRQERGAVAVLVAVAIASLLGLVALVLNVGHRLDTRAELQNAADSAALAGAWELTGQLAPIQAGLPNTLAARFSSRHTSGAGVAVDIDPATDVTVGHWDPYATNPAAAFTPLVVRSDEDAFYANAVRIRNGRETARGSALQVFMNRLLDAGATQDVASEAVAVNGGPCTMECPTVPFVFFDCGFFRNYQLNCGSRLRMTATLNPDPSDTVGFSSLSDTVPANTDVYRDILSSGPGCERYRVQSGDPVAVSNGAQLQPLCAILRERIGQVSVAPIVHDSCPPRFNQVHPVIGFASFMIVAVECTGNPKYVEFEFRCNETVPDADRIGCGFYGTGPLRPKLVR